MLILIKYGFINNYYLNVAAFNSFKGKIKLQISRKSQFSLKKSWRVHLQRYFALTRLSRPKLVSDGWFTHL